MDFLLSINSFYSNMIEVEHTTHQITMDISIWRIGQEHKILMEGGK